MIISRSPLRITLAGGGTDLPSFYEKHGSRFLSCSIDKYIYVGFREKTFDNDVRVQYLDTEIVNKVSDLKHSRARACLQSFGFETKVEVNSVADLSARSGMGSSGSYLVGLIACLRAHLGLPHDPEAIASEACRIEMEVLREPVGKQDQYISSYGGITEFEIDRLGNVTANRLDLHEGLQRDFEKNCMIFYTGVLRNASDVLRVQQTSIRKDDTAMCEIQKIGNLTIDSLKIGDLDKFGSLLHDHWTQKRRFGSSMTVDSFDAIYEKFVTEKKVLGGKIIGAGGGGFMMLYVPKCHDRIEEEMLELGYPRMNWKVSREGVTLCKW